MIFGKKDKKKCEICGSHSDEKFSFCPHCGNSFIDERKEQEDFGLLGRTDAMDQRSGNSYAQPLGITDKLLTSLFNTVVKSLDKQLKDQFNEFERDMERAEIQTFPNGIRIKIGGPVNNSERKQKKKQNTIRKINPEQLKKMSTLPRTKAKTNVKRIGDLVVYELATPGVSSAQDVFVSKLESGYEIKAIGNKKIYVNSIPINLPLKRCSILNNKLLVEFNTRG